jgi:hypothetical protein
MYTKGMHDATLQYYVQALVGNIGMSFFGDFFAPFLTLFVVAKGVEAAVPPSDNTAGNVYGSSAPAESNWQSRVSSEPPNELGL